MSSEEQTPNVQPSASEETGGSSSASAQPSKGKGSATTANSGALRKAENKSVGDDEYIDLRVMSNNLTNKGKNVVRFSVKSTAALECLKNLYCSKLQLKVDDLRFVFNGFRIKDTDTPKSLGMIDDDVIELYLEKSSVMQF